MRYMTLNNGDNILYKSYKTKYYFNDEICNSAIYEC